MLWLCTASESWPLEGAAEDGSASEHVTGAARRRPAKPALGRAGGRSAGAATLDEGSA